MPSRLSAILVRASLILSVTLAGALSLGLGCGPAPDAKQPAASASAQAGAPIDRCKDSPPATGVYKEILRDLKCEQDLYLRMATVAGDLGVDCSHCHVPIPGPKKDFDYPTMTEHKQMALFMNHMFMDGLKQKDGEPMKCRSCHVDKNGKPAAKFLGEPRDNAYALEWMNLVMVNKFTKLDGSKLKCKDCHVGNVGTPEFKPSVILHAEQINLPGVTPFVRYPDPGVAPTPTPTPSVSASTGPAPSASASAPKPPASTKPPVPIPTPSSASSSPTLFPATPKR